MRRPRLFIVYVLIITILLFSGSLYYYKIRTKDDVGVEDLFSEKSVEEKCVSVGGTLREFSNGCVDSCAYVRNPGVIFCTQAITEGCDCGLDRCWNGERCEDI